MWFFSKLQNFKEYIFCIQYLQWMFLRFLQRKYQIGIRGEWVNERVRVKHQEEESQLSFLKNFSKLLWKRYMKFIRGKEKKNYILEGLYYGLGNKSILKIVQFCILESTMEDSSWNNNGYSREMRFSL